MNIITADEALLKTVENCFPDHINEISVDITKAISSGKRYVYIDEFDNSLTSKSLNNNVAFNDDCVIVMIERYLLKKGYHVDLFTGTVTGCKQPDVSRSWLHISW